MEQLVMQFNEPMSGLVQELKEHSQDFEFYPTTADILRVVADDIKLFRKAVSVLDIGAGNGNALNTLESLLPENVVKYAIEKSMILIDHMSPDIFVIGTDFHQQTLIDKKMDVTFCNPPYSEYENWAIKILSEANSKYIYMVIPERWKNNKYIQSIIEKRNIGYEIIGSDDFLDSEYRKARAKVDIIKFSHEARHYGSDEISSDPFDLWFESAFNIKADQENERDYNLKEEKKKEIRNEIVKGQNIIERLEELYRRDFETLLDNYRAIEKLDYSIFKELGVDIAGLKIGLKQKISGLKDLYWNELFNNMDAITARLTKKSRSKIFSRLTAHTSIDFTSQNAYAVVLWVIKNSNVYLDEQLKDVYLWMSRKENIVLYKSNKGFVQDGWRYDAGKQTHYKLDYRLVFHGYNNFNSSSWGNYDYPNGLHKGTHDNINDIITVGKNLGFAVEQNTFNFEWESGAEYTFTCGKEAFMKIRAYKNGNIHCKPSQKFIKKLNIEAARLNGWVKDVREAAEEMDIPEAEVKEFYQSNYQITAKTSSLLLGCSHAIFNS